MTDKDPIDEALELIDKRRARRFQAREEKRAIRNHARDNAKGKLKKRSRTGGPCGRFLNHKRPANFKRNLKENPMASLGYTDEEYEQYLKTGKTKENN